MRQDLQQPDDTRQEPELERSSNAGAEQPAQDIGFRQEATPRNDPQYDEYLQWRRQRAAPWYNKGWVWLLVATFALLVIAWLFFGLGEAIRGVADATRDQTSALQEQTDVMREQGTWLRESLQGLERLMNTLAVQVGQILQVMQNWLNAR